MKTLLVPVDFTSTSDNASEFAMAWSRNFEYNHIILLKSFYSSFYENALLTTEYADVCQSVERMKWKCSGTSARNS